MQNNYTTGWRKNNPPPKCYGLPTIPDFRQDQRWHISWQDLAGKIQSRSYRTEEEAQRQYNYLINN